MLKAPKLTLKHREKRVEFATETLTRSRSLLRNVIWCDEKRFNLDGPHGWTHHKADLRRDDKVFSTRQNGGGSVMFWGRFSTKGELT